MPEKKINMAEIARKYNISYQLLTKKIKSGLPLAEAIDECIIDRDARLSSGSRPHRSSRGQDPISFRGTTYATFSAACQALGLSPSSAYAQRSRLIKEERLPVEQASIRVLERAIENAPKKRKRNPVVINGVAYDSQVQAAQALGISMGTIAARRVRDNVSFGEAIRSLLEKRDAVNLTYAAHHTGAYWAKLKAALVQSIHGAEDLSSHIYFLLLVTRSGHIPARIVMLSPNYATIYTDKIPFISENDIDKWNAKYYGIKLVVEHGHSVIARCDVPLSGRINTDVAQILRVQGHCHNVLMDIYSHSAK